MYKPSIWEYPHDYGSLQIVDLEVGEASLDWRWWSLTCWTLCASQKSLFARTRKDQHSTWANMFGEKTLHSEAKQKEQRKQQALSSKLWRWRYSIRTSRLNRCKWTESSHASGLWCIITCDGLWFLIAIVQFSGCYMNLKAWSQLMSISMLPYVWKAYAYTLTCCWWVQDKAVLCLQSTNSKDAQ